MLVVALGTLTAVAMSANLQRDLRRTTSLIERDRAMQVALGAEMWAKGVLARDGAATKTDALRDDWAQPIRDLPVEGGYLSGGLEDLQGRFNLNSLIQDGKRSALAMERFETLLSVLGVSPGLAAAVADWIDADSEVDNYGGAEDFDYLSRRPPYHAANRPFVSVTELRQVKGIDERIYRKLAPFVAALPEVTPINVNTAPLEVIMALSPEMTRGAAEEVVLARGRDGFQDLVEFTTLPALERFQILPQGLTLLSNHFLGLVRVRMGRTLFVSRVYLQRGVAGATVRMREEGEIL
ncbi:MAG: type II secretion system minor pseudopilin GspK [Magnetococcales bacterium]|nr:type II secretion system minor pseudopilin GspK [Magnetococcales bacterium]